MIHPHDNTRVNLYLNNYLLKSPKILKHVVPKNLKKLPLHLGSCDKNSITFTFVECFYKKTILNVKNLENSIKAGAQMRTHD
jgi:hypothetical protein